MAGRPLSGRGLSGRKLSGRGLGKVGKGGGGASSYEPPEGDYTPSLDFSDARNSQYIGQVV